MENSNAIIFFDGICRLCNGFVRFLIKRDKKKKFKYVSIQSKVGQLILSERNIPDPDSVVLFYKNSFYFKFDAIIEIARLLSFPWSYFRVIKFIPKKWRDYGYDFVAKNRFKWFGKLDSCEITFN